MATNSIETLAANYAKAKAEAEQAAKVQAEASAAFIEAMEKAGMSSIVITDALGGECRETVVGGSTVTTDWEAMKASGKVKPTVWKKMVKEVVDPKKAEALVVTGDLDINIVEQFSEEKPRKKFVKVTGTYDPDTLGLVRSGPKRKATMTPSARKP